MQGDELREHVSTLMQEHGYCRLLAIIRDTLTAATNERRVVPEGEEAASGNPAMLEHYLELQARAATAIYDGILNAGEGD